jgi:vitamin B12 transporter
MKASLLRPRWAALPLALAMANHAAAQTGGTLSPLVVTATRSAIPLTDVLADVSIVDRAGIERSGATSIADVLQRLPGVSITQAGGPAATTGVFIRGADSRFAAVFIDGARIDSQSTGGATWEAIPVSQIERIEVLRGPAAAIYGSDAVAGVVQIFTRRGESGLLPSVRVAAGSYATRQADVGLRGGNRDVDYSLAVAEDRSGGFNAKPTGSNPDRDGYRNRSFSGSVGWKPATGHLLELTLLDNDQRAGYDSSPAPVTDIALHHVQAAGLHWSAQWTQAWSTRIDVTQGIDRYETRPSPYLTETRLRTTLLRNEVHVGPGLLTADIERREDALQNSSTQPSRNTHREQDAVALGYAVRLGRHMLQVNARHDDDSEFGGKSTGALAYGYAITPQWRATASAGTAFRVPTLFQRFSIYGVPTLRPETSRNQELGLRWESGVHRASVVAYRNTVSNLINYVSGPGSCINGSAQFPGCYGNTGHARIGGATLSGSTQWAGVNLDGSIDWMSPRNLDTGKLLARRPREQSRFAASWPVAGWQWGVEVQHVGKRFNEDANTTPLAAYTLVGLVASRKLDRDWSLVARIDNLTDKDYVLARGYATAGRSFHAALSWAPGR